ncbi:ceramidase-domain-containing protein [Amylocarpus encephaloides]|uniref:Ceramidase-domain-containing protein n=1 Tax=Amylocarpus encephaloides TaxID=45428 RepID=A0A9P8C158_9HELO|nr:ceramidase-domain-containing protein [Amylocarpus encephaloides]
MDFYSGNLASTETSGIIHRGPFSWPYPQNPQSPFWGPPNSAANFCEEDYIITSYIAEFVNTLTNLTYIFYAYQGMRKNSNRPDALLRNLPYLGLASVGIGSGLFHSTLKNYTQWGDELSMLVATATVLHRLFTFDKSLAYTAVYGTIGTALMVAFITWHCITDELIMHSVVFAIMIAIVGVKTHSMIGARVTDPAVQRDVKSLSIWGGVIFIGGFGIWNIDNATCGILTTAKRTIGMPWSFVLELHGWWHVCTGVGAYIFIALVEYLTSEEAGQSLGSRFAWPVGYFITGRSSDVKENRNRNQKYSNGKSSEMTNGNGATKITENGYANSNENDHGCAGGARQKKTC